MKEAGKFITFEGVEGSGKSTQIQLVSKFLKARGVSLIITREPGATDIGKKLRSVLLDPLHDQMDPRCETFLYMADRSQHLAERVLPALSSGTWVLCDRYHDSTLAYQGFARGIKGLSYDGFRKPDLTLLLDLEPRVGLSRAIARNQEKQLDQEARFEQETLAFHEKVRQGFHMLVDQEPNRFAVVNASGGVDEIFSRLIPHLRILLESTRV